MRLIRVRNVDEALKIGVWTILSIGMEESSRNGPVIVAPEPVTTLYGQPMERVCLYPGRDANPFFHLFESMWMLYGSNDATWLDSYVSDFSSRYAEPDGQMHGAYGYRWREHFSSRQTAGVMDQLRIIASLIDQNPDSRQLVLSMWDPYMDLNDQVLKDRPCNTHVYFRVRDNGINGYALDTTVLCRSNDIIWGAYGANAVHMSIMMEYVAALCKRDVRPGRMWQVSNNWHIYSDQAEKFRKLLNDTDWYANYQSPYIPGKVEITPLFDRSHASEARGALHTWMNLPNANIGYPLVDRILAPMHRAHETYTVGKNTPGREGLHLMERASDMCSLIEGSDWSLACREWIDRRAAVRKTKLIPERVESPK